MPHVRQSLVDEISAITPDSWRTLRMMSEMVTAFDELNALGREMVTIFGSARLAADSPDYIATLEIAAGLAKAGYGVITGGGPGIMEAGNRGATENGADSVGLHIHLPNEQSCNPYVRRRCDFRYFGNRKFMFMKYSSAFVVMPGGMGTIDELSDAFVLMQTRRMPVRPIVLYDSQFWSGLLEWMKTVMVGRGLIRAEEIDRLVTIYDEPGQVVDHIRRMIPL